MLAAVATHPPVTSTHVEVQHSQFRSHTKPWITYGTGFSSPNFNFEQSEEYQKALQLVQSLFTTEDPEVTQAIREASIEARLGFSSIRLIYLLLMNLQPARIVATEGSGFMIAYQLSAGRATYEIDGDGDMAYLWEDANGSEIKDILPQDFPQHVQHILKKIGTL